MPFDPTAIQLARTPQKVVAKVKTGQQGPLTPKRQRAISTRGGLPGFPLTPQATYETFEEMSKNPTLFLAKTIVTAPVRRNNWTWCKSKKCPAQWYNLAKDNLDPLRMSTVRDGLRALEMEMAAFELVWTRKNNATWLQRLKPLAEYPQTTILTDGGGNVIGLENKSKGINGKEGKEVKLDNDSCFIYRHEPTVLRPYGFSRYENCLKDWARSEHIGEKLAQYLGKISGIIVQCHYPDGTGLDANGAPRPNFWLAEDLLEQVAVGRSVAIPNKFASFLGGDDGMGPTQASMEKALAAAGKSDWVLSAFDPGGTDYSKGFLDTLAYYDKRMFRGWGRGERSGIEAESGGMGTSDAGTHTDTGLLDAELIDQDFAAAFSKGVIDKLLVQNFGDNAAGAVWVEPTPLVDTTVQTASALLTAAMASPFTAPLVAKIIDWGQIGENAGVPLVKDVAGAIASVQNATQNAAADPAAAGEVQDLMRQMRAEIQKLSRGLAVSGNGRH